MCELAQVATYAADHLDTERKFVLYVVAGFADEWEAGWRADECHIDDPPPDHGIADARLGQVAALVGITRESVVEHLEALADDDWSQVERINEGWPHSSMLIVDGREIHEFTYSYRFTGCAERHEIGWTISPDHRGLS